MSELIELFNKASNKVRFRYQEDATFNSFKKYMRIERWFILLGQILIFAFLIYRAIFFIFISGFNNINLGSLLLSAGLFAWLIYAFKEFATVKRYIKLVNNDPKEIEKELSHTEWQLKDIILKEPLDLREDKIKKISYKRPKKKEGYVLYFLCRNYNAGSRWIGITNIKNAAITTNTAGTRVYDEDELIQGNKVILDVKEKMINDEFKDDTPIGYDINLRDDNGLKGDALIKRKDKNTIKFNPVQIIAIRIRSNIFNEPVEIKNFEIK